MTNKVKAKMVFETPDGRLFATRKAANGHERMRTVMESLRLFTASASNTLAVDLMNDPSKAESLRNALNQVLQYHRDYGKLAKNG